MNISLTFSAGLKFQPRPAVRFQADRPDENKPVTKVPVDEKKLNARLKLALRNPKFPIPVFIQTQGALSPEQIGVLAQLGLQASPIAGSIATGRLQSAERLGEITQLSYIHFLEASQKMRSSL